jgi:hypothetical protein
VAQLCAQGIWPLWDLAQNLTDLHRCCTAQPATELQRTFGSVAVLLLLAGAVPPPLALVNSPDESPSAAPISAAGALPVSVVVLPAASAPPRNQPNRSASAPDVVPAACNRGKSMEATHRETNQAMKCRRLDNGQQPAYCCRRQCHQRHADISCYCSGLHICAGTSLGYGGGVHSLVAGAVTVPCNMVDNLKHSLGRQSHLSALNRRPQSGRQTASPAARTQVTSALPS